MQHRVKINQSSNASKEEACSCHAASRGAGMTIITIVIIMIIIIIIIIITTIIIIITTIIITTIIIINAIIIIQLKHLPGTIRMPRCRA